jgi:hypothetical protein
MGNIPPEKVLLLSVSLLVILLVAGCVSASAENNAPLAATISANSSIPHEDCSTCHGDPPRFGQPSEWAQSGHSNIALAQELGTSASCTRCHSSQGFQLWLQQGTADPTLGIQGANGTATAAEMAAMGFTTDNVAPQTCDTCHDPNGPGGNLRVVNDTPLLAAGYKATGLGKGAICVVCHNSRTTIRDWTATIGYGLPHTSVQGDVLMGTNAYLVANQSQRSPYATQDSCVTCHMGPSPSAADLANYLARPQKAVHYKYTDTCTTCHVNDRATWLELSSNLTGGNHTFVAGVNSVALMDAKASGQAIQADTMANMNAVNQAMGDYLLKKMPARVTINDDSPHQYAGKSYDLKSDAVIIDKSNIASLNFTSVALSQGFDIIFKTPVSFTYAPDGENAHTMQLSHASVQLSDIGDGSKVLIPVNDKLVEAGYNYFIVYNDGSLGIHNPGFVANVLNASLQALK